jgi:DNA-binding PadR family transcriptional regulator
MLCAVLELAILGLLKEQDLHGYELKKRLSETLGVGASGFGRGVSFGSLYPALSRLEAAGAVVALTQPAMSAASPSPTIPLTGSLGGELAVFRSHRVTSRVATRGGRAKKVYQLTDRGAELFADLLLAETETGADDRVFNLRLAFARYLAPEARIGLLERRRGQLVERLARIGTRIRAGRDRLDGYARSLIEHDREATEHDLSWIDRLIASERGSHLAGSDPAEPAEARTSAPAAAAPSTAPAAAAADLTLEASPPSFSGLSPTLAGLRPLSLQEDHTP